MLLIDAHNEYGECFDDRAVMLGPENLKLPFWLFNFDEIVQIIFGTRGRADLETGLLAELIPLAKTEYARTRQTLRSSYKVGAIGRRAIHGRHAGAVSVRRRYRARPRTAWASWKTATSRSVTSGC